MPDRLINTISVTSIPNYRFNIRQIGSSIYIQFQNFHNGSWNNYQITVLRLSTARQYAFVGSMRRTRVATVNRVVWASVSSEEIYVNNIILTGRNCGYYIHEITRNTIRFSHLNLSSIERIYLSDAQVRLNPQMMRANFTVVQPLENFLGDMYRERLSVVPEYFAVAAIVVAVITGIAMTVGFGLAAAASGMGSSLAGTAAGSTIGLSSVQAGVLNAVCNAIASGTTNFLQGCFNQMVQTIQIDSRIQAIDRQLHSASLSTTRRSQLETQKRQLIRNASHDVATHFWNNREMTNVISSAVIAGAFSFGTTYIPSGTGLSARADLNMANISTILQGRMANNMTGVVQTLVTNGVQGQSPDWNNIERTLILDSVVRSIN